MDFKKTALSLVMILLGIFVIFQRDLLMDWKVSLLCLAFLVLGFSLGKNQRDKEKKKEKEDEEGRKEK